MIDINLVPPTLRRKKKRNILPGGLKIPKEVFIGGGGGLVVLLVLLHVGLQVLIFQKIFYHQYLKKEWESLKPSKEKADAVLHDLRALQAKIKAIEDITSGETILWSQKINILSDVLPRGVWFRKLALSDEVLFIEGSSISQKNSEMLNIHNFTNALKKEKDFMDDSSDLELGSIQSRKIQQTDVADFLIKIKLK